MKILGIESTCDETSVGIVEDGSKVLSSVISSSAALHIKYGGIVPEVAAREQVRLIVPVLEEALVKANSTLEDIDAIAVAYGPGLIGSLLVGVEASKSIALSCNKPLIPVNHLVGHLYANWTDLQEVERPKFPLIALIVSGGHTDLILMKGFGEFKLIGASRDDSAGEAFDKVSRALGEGYPGGPIIETLSSYVNSSSYKLPRPMLSSKDLDFSFSGLKTAVVNLVKNHKITKTFKSEVAFEFQESVLEVLVKKTFDAVEKFQIDSVIVGGGVSANSKLRDVMTYESNRKNVKVFFPEKKYSGDNGVMIATAAFFEKSFIDPLILNANPSLHF